MTGRFLVAVAFLLAGFALVIHENWKIAAGLVLIGWAHNIGSGGRV